MFAQFPLPNCYPLLRLANGKHSLYLDYYLNGKRKYEFLKLYTHRRPKDETQKQHNGETLEMAKRIRNKREAEMASSVHGIELPRHINTDLLPYYEKFVEEYPKKDKRLAST